MNRQRSIEAYKMRSAVANALVYSNIDVKSILRLESVNPGLTSFGDLKMLNIFDQFLPSSGNAASLTIEDVFSYVRLDVPGSIATCFQYDDQLRLTVTKGTRFSTQEDVDLQAEVVREWIDAIISS